MSITDMNATLTSPSQSLARATRKPRGTADGAWNEMVTLRDKFGWRQREVAILMDISDAMVSYVAKQPDLALVPNKSESQLVRELFAPVRDDNGQPDVEASLHKAANYNNKLSAEDAKGLAEAIQNGEAYAPKAAAARPAAAPRSPRSGFAATTSNRAAVEEAANEPAYVPNPVEVAMLKLAGALHSYEESKAVTESFTANNPYIPRNMLDETLQAAAEADARHSELSRELARSQVARLREVAEFKRLPVRDMPLSVAPAAAPQPSITTSPDAHAKVGFQQIAAPHSNAMNDASMAAPVLKEKDLKLA